MDNTNFRLPTWASPLPASRFFDLSSSSQPGIPGNNAFFRWVYDSAYDMFEEFRSALGPENTPGEGDGSGQLEDMGDRCAYFNFDGLGAELVSNPQQAWVIATEACDKAIFDFLQTCEPELEEQE